MTSPLADRAAIVTGAGSGIGRATTVRLVADGAHVLAVDRNAEGLADTLELAAAGPGRCAMYHGDVTDQDTPAGMVAACREQFGDVRILVNNAGIGASVAAHLTEDADLDRFLDVNLRALFRCARETVAAMRGAAGGGVIIQIASIFGMVGVPNSSIYSATKAAVIGLTQNMAADYGPYGIRVNAISPGMILTPINEDRFRENAWFQDLLLTATPLGRVGAPQDIANGIAFLCSDEANFITGHTLVIDGGWSSTRFRPFPPDLHD